MAKKISELTSISTISGSDVLPIVDVSANTTNKISMSNIIDLIYPVGALFITTNSTNPGTYLGGTWTQVSDDAYLKIVSSNAGTLDGTSSDHTIPISSMPAHTHTGQRHYQATSGATGYSSSWTSQNYIAENTGSTGGGQPYYPYYYGVYVFVRTA